MKTLKDHIDEALKIGKNLSKFSTYSCQPKTTKELKQIIEERINKEGPNCDLNDIDTSLITDMASFFYNSNFNGDISCWDTSNVTNMINMFAYSKFNGDISNWDISNVDDLYYMFAYSIFNSDISKWNVINVVNMSYMFCDAKFTGDISKWKINLRCYVTSMFSGCPIKNHLKPKLPI